MVLMSFQNGTPEERTSEKITQKKITKTTSRTQSKIHNQSWLISIQERLLIQPRDTHTCILRYCAAWSLHQQFQFFIQLQQSSSSGLCGLTSTCFYISIPNQEISMRIFTKITTSCGLKWPTYCIWRSLSGLSTSSTQKWCHYMV